jgi:hypothetical protein
MKPLFAITTGIALYFVWGIYWLLSEYALSRPKALVGSIIGSLLFGFYAVQEFRKMMRAADTRHEDERKWVEKYVSVGSGISEAQNLLRERFALKQKADGFSLLAGSTTVYDFTSSLSDLRIVTKADSIISIKVSEPNEERA